ncbi:DUF255 domain-containing protein [Pendulispora brunnea]|uniref:DUF255 domain-containing protein n=1 Tax=Pendulispora brunnea TaxID=2905690 RepID=A0ABZ2K4F7_9BACT
MTRRLRRTWQASILGCVLGLSGCAHPTQPPRMTHRSEPSRGPDASPKEPLDWAPFDARTFERAKRERKFIVLDGSAEWCHWCHVMESTTYHDAKVASVLQRHFIAAKVDVDARPDIEERYRAWGWPATVIFSPDGDELGKYRGYMAPGEFADLLAAVVAAGPNAARVEAAAERPTPDTPLAAETLAWAAHWAEVELEEYWDPKEGGWGVEPKVPIHENTEFALKRATRGDTRLREHALTVLEKQRNIIDPVWGGIYQYSVAPDWVHPHFEKLMEFNAGALADYAAAYTLTHDERWLRAARDIDRYLRAFMISPEGGFHGTQDADLNAHDREKRFMDGHDYYRLGDRERRALGVPRVDPNEYAEDGGLAIAAYVTLYEATRDASALAIAKRASARVAATHTAPRGGITHGIETEPPRLLHLADHAAYGYALARLHDVEPDAATLAAAKRVADFALAELYDPNQGGFYTHTRDPDAVGVFQRRRKPFNENMLMLRFLVKLRSKLQGTGPTTEYAKAIDKSLRYWTDPERMKDAGRFIGDYLSLVDEISSPSRK